jgi:hypothetical protein
VKLKRRKLKNSLEISRIKLLNFKSTIKVVVKNSTGSYAEFFIIKSDKLDRDFCEKILKKTIKNFKRKSRAVQKIQDF